MQKNIKFIKEKLSHLYPERELESFTVWILSHVLGYDRTQIIMKEDRILPEDVSIKIENMVDRLTNQEPIQYITGDTEFAGLNLNVKPGVLVPRPETEELVSRIANGLDIHPKKILDIGTGSGCIALALKKYLPAATVYACDISNEALNLSRENARLNNLDVNIFYYDVLTEKGDLPVNEFDLIVSNPPYILESEKEFMHANVLNFEPHLALFVPDNDPLKFYKAITAFAKRHLAEGAKIWFEINENRSDDVVDLLRLNNFKDVKPIIDIFGKMRFVCGFK